MQTMSISFRIMRHRPTAGHGAQTVMSVGQGHSRKDSRERTAIRSISLRLQGMPRAFPRNREPSAKSASEVVKRSMRTGRSEVQC